MATGQLAKSSVILEQGSNLGEKNNPLYQLANLCKCVKRPMTIQLTSS